jgi:environmental stress-induced protein Ves
VAHRDLMTHGDVRIHGELMGHRDEMTIEDVMTHGEVLIHRASMAHSDVMAHGDVMAYVCMMACILSSFLFLAMQRNKICFQNSLPHSYFDTSC